MLAIYLFSRTVPKIVKMLLRRITSKANPSQQQHDVCELRPLGPCSQPGSTRLRKRIRWPAGKLGNFLYTTPLFRQMSRCALLQRRIKTLNRVDLTGWYQYDTDDGRNMSVGKSLTILINNIPIILLTKQDAKPGT